MFSGPHFLSSVSCPLFHSDLLGILTKSTPLPEKLHFNQPSVQTLASTEVTQERGKTSTLASSLRARCSSAQWVQPRALGGSGTAANNFWAQVIGVLRIYPEKYYTPL